MDALANLRAEIPAVGAGGPESQRGVRDPNDADLAPARCADPNQPAKTAVAQRNRPLDKPHNNIANHLVEEAVVSGPTQTPEIIYDLRQRCCPCSAGSPRASATASVASIAALMPANSASTARDPRRSSRSTPCRASRSRPCGKQRSVWSVWSVIFPLHPNLSARVSLRSRFLVPFQRGHDRRVGMGPLTPY